MKKNSSAIHSKSAAWASGLLLSTTTATAIFLQALSAPSLTAEIPLQLPHQVTPWTPLPPGTLPLPLVESPALSTTTWTLIGPAALQSSNRVSGRITGIAPHPTLSTTIFVAAAGGGVWRTTNGGTGWSPLTALSKTNSMGAIAIGTGVQETIYAGTGEANNSLDSNYGYGILVSKNGGTSWSLTTGPANAFNRLTTSQIAVDPTNSAIAYAAMADFGNNGLGGNTGVWKTTDSGTVWTNTTTTINSAVPWSAVVIDPTNPQTLYAAVGDIFGATSNGVYKSTNGGTSWTLLSAAPNGKVAGRIAIAVSPSNSQVVYVAVAGSGNAGSTAIGALYKIMRSDNGGSTFTDLTSGTPNYMGGQGWYDMPVVVDPSNSAIVYVAGQAGTNSILRSTNSGVSWSDISSGGSTPHADHHALVFDAAGRLLDGDDGGIYRLNSVAPVSWTDLNSNQSTIQFEGIGLHPTNANIAIGGSQDNGTEVYSGNRVWTETDGGDGGFAKFSRTNGSRAYHQIPNASFGTNFFRRSDNGGSTWATKTSSIAADVNSQNFYAPFVVDPGNGDRVLYGTNRVWETTTAGDAWQTLSQVGINGWNPSGYNVDAIGLAPSTVNTVYAAANGHIFVTTNHGAGWVEVSIPGNPHVQDLQVDPSTPAIAYAVISQFHSGGNVFRTTNGGTTWTNISGNLPKEPVWSLQIGSVSGTLYIGADDGVFVTTNTGSTWSRLGKGLPRAQVFQIELNSSLHILGAGTHGRSMWEITAN